MMDLFIIVIILCGLVLALAFTFYVVQWIIRVFILETLPILAELYGRIRYPKEFIDKDS